MAKMNFVLSVTVFNCQSELETKTIWCEKYILAWLNGGGNLHTSATRSWVKNRQGYSVQIEKSFVLSKAISHSLVWEIYQSHAWCGI